MTQEIDYTQALADIKAGLQNVLPRTIKEGNTVKITQGSETITLPLAAPVTSTTIMK
ncbi:hypothetical protein [Pseudanabaena phage PA-SR01]|nr:hypothetical protein [Pseudanabaena phage PA-SR01]